MHASGQIRLLGAHIRGDLNLSDATLNNPGWQRPNRRPSEISGDMVCTDGFSATGEMRLVGAHIGQLTLSGATLTNPDGDAPSADGAEITGDMYCKDLNATGQRNWPAPTHRRPTCSARRHAQKP